MESKNASGCADLEDVMSVRSQRCDDCFFGSKHAERRGREPIEFRFEVNLCLLGLKTHFCHNDDNHDGLKCHGLAAFIERTKRIGVEQAFREIGV